MSYYGQRLIPSVTSEGRYLVGDPGFWGSLWGGIKSIGGQILGGAPSGGGTGKGSVATIEAISKIAGSLGGRARDIGGKMVPRVGKAAVPVAIGAAAGAGIASMTVNGGGGRARGGGSRGGRRMNVTNVRALRRSIRRCQGFAKLAKRVLRFTSPRPLKGRVTFKSRSRKR